LWKTLTKGEHLEDLGVDGKILKWILEKWYWGGGMDWLDLAKCRERSQAAVNAVMNLQDL
jgi:hypothetical protein